MNLSFKPETKNEFYKRLHQPPKLSSNVRKPVTSAMAQQYTEMKECTFKPKINGDSPFVSERTLRNQSLQVGITDTDKTDEEEQKQPGIRRKRIVKNGRTGVGTAGAGGSLPMCGTFLKGVGFQRGPPMNINVPLYYINASFPPQFDTGKYVTESIVPAAGGAPGGRDATSGFEDVEVTDEEASGSDDDINAIFKPPPLPTWANSAGGDPARGKAANKPVKIVINKSAKKPEEKAEVTGWASVMAEMAKKREALAKGTGQLKKVEEKPKAKPQKKKKKKKGGDAGFTDVMDELSYKLAKMRGEIVDDDDDDDSEDEGNAAAAASRSKPAAKAATNTLPSVATDTDAAASASAVEGEKAEKSPVRSKLTVKPSLANMLAKIKTPAAAAVSTDASAPAPAEKVISSSATTPAGALSGSAADATSWKRAVPETDPSKVPFAPPPPPMWPPTPYVPPAKPPGASSSSSSSSNASNGASGGGKAAAGGNKRRKTKTIRRPITLSSSSSSSSSSNANNTAAAVGASSSELIAVDIPDGYYMEEHIRGTVDPGKFLKGGVVSEALLEDLKLKFSDGGSADSGVSMIEVERRATRGNIIDKSNTPNHKHIKVEDRLSSSDLPLPPNFHSTVDRMRKSKELREQRHIVEQSKELRSFLLPGKKPIVGQEVGRDGEEEIVSSAAVAPLTPSSFQYSSSVSPGKKKAVTVPVDFSSNVVKHMESKQFSFRKSVATQNGPAESIDTTIPRVINNPNYLMSGDNVPNAYWMSNLRADTNKYAAPYHHGKPRQQSSSSSSSQSQRVSSTSAYDTYSATVKSNNSVNGNYNDFGSGRSSSYIRARSPSAMSMSELSYANAHQSSSSPHNRLRNSGNGGCNGSGGHLYENGENMYGNNNRDDISVFTDTSGPGYKYINSNFRPLTQPSSPQFRADEVVYRKQSARQMRQHQERLLQEEEQRQLQARNELLRMKAQRAAMEHGALRDNSGSRFHRHQKLVSRYNGQEHVGIDLDLMAREAYLEYSHTHLAGKQDYYAPLTPGGSSSSSSRKHNGASNNNGFAGAPNRYSADQDFSDYDDASVGSFDFR